MIVVGGESLVDLVPVHSGVDGALTALSPRIGGGPLNTAIGAGRLGAEVAFLSRISTDVYGEAVVERLRLSNVDTSLVQSGEQPTTLASVAVGRDGAARYTFYIENTADRLLADPGPLPRRCTVLSLGTLGMVLEPGASAYEAVLRREAARGIVTVLDPNIRAELIADPHAYRERFAGWLPHVSVLKVSEEDTAWLTGGTAPLDAAAEWLRSGPSAVLLTRGAGGMVALTRTGDPVHVPAETVPVADTIGAGDTVHAGLLVRLANTGVRQAHDVAALDGDWWRHTLRYAASAAAITVARDGAQPPWRGELPHVVT